MDRKDFLRNSAIFGGATLLPSNNVFSKTVTENGIDKLVDSDGNFIQKPLRAVKGANKDHSLTAPLKFDN